MGIEQNGRTLRLVPAQSHAAYMSTRPCNCAPSAMTNRGAARAPSTEPVSPIRTSSLAWMLPFTLPRTKTDFADNCALTLSVRPTEPGSGSPGRPAESNAIRALIGREMGYGDALEHAVGQEFRARCQHARLPVRTPRIAPRPRESPGRRGGRAGRALGTVGRVEVAVDDKHADRNHRAPKNPGYGRNGRRELLAPNRYGKSSRRVATLGCGDLQAS